MGPKRATYGEAQNMLIRVSTSFETRACSYCGYSSRSSATVAGSLITISQNIDLLGSTHFGIAALTVIMGSLTTWLSRNFMATLHSK